MVAACALDGDDVVLDAMLVQGLVKEPHGGFQTGLIMLDDGGWDEDSTVKVGEQPFWTGPWRNRPGSPSARADRERPRPMPAPASDGPSRG